MPYSQPHHICNEASQMQQWLYLDPMGVRAMLKYFPDRYELHISQEAMSGHTYSLYIKRNVLYLYKWECAKSAKWAPPIAYFPLPANCEHHRIQCFYETGGLKVIIPKMIQNSVCMLTP